MDSPAKRVSYILYFSALSGQFPHQVSRLKSVSIF